MGAAFQAIEHPKLLLGEGEDEVRFFRSLLQHLGLHDIQVAQTGGKRQRIHAFLKALPSFPGFSSLSALGVTCDADGDAHIEFQSICGGLGHAGFSVPGRMGERTTGPLHVSVYVLPDCASEGTLETLCLNSVADDPAAACVDQYFACVEREAKRQPANRWKARVHAWLSSHERPDLRLGEAAERRYWPFDGEAFAPLCAFLRQL